MNYKKIYNDFIEDRKSKPIPTGYTEKHHIVPRHVGGTNEKSNMIILTAPDHYFAHLVFAKAEDTREAWHAVFAMATMKGERRKYTIARRWFEKARIAASITIGNCSRGRVPSEETRKKLSEAGKGRKQSPESIALLVAFHTGRKRSAETCARISEKAKGRIVSDEARAKMSASRKGRKPSDATIKAARLSNTGRKASEETRIKIGNASRGRFHSEETKKKMSESTKGFKHTPEAIEKTRLANIGRKMSDASRLKMSISATGRKATEEAKKNMAKAQIGRTHSEETKRKISLSGLGVPKTEAHKAKISGGNHYSARAVRCIETGIEYAAASVAKNITGIGHVSEACHGKVKKAGGYHWEFV